MLTNIKPVNPFAHIAPTPITDPAEIRSALEAAGVVVGPDPGRDGQWAATVEHTDSDGSTSMVELVAFTESVKAIRRGVPERGRLAVIVGDRLVLR